MTILRAIMDEFLPKIASDWSIPSKSLGNWSECNSAKLARVGSQSEMWMIFSLTVPFWFSFNKEGECKNAGVRTPPSANVPLPAFVL